MIDICFCYPTEDIAKKELSMFLDSDNNWLPASYEHAIDIVGTLYKIEPTYIQLTSINDLPNIIQTQLEGFHINLRVWGNMITKIQELNSSYVVNPKNQQRIWA